jgi:hypothetical protein
MKGCMCGDRGCLYQGAGGAKGGEGRERARKKTVELAKGREGNVRERGKARERPARNQRS